MLRSAPATVHQPSFGHVAFVVGTDGGLWWSSERTGLDVHGRPAGGRGRGPGGGVVGRRAYRRVRARRDNHLWQLWTACGGLSAGRHGLKPVGDDGTLASSPTATSWAAGRLDVFVLGTDGSVYQRFWDGSASGGIGVLAGPGPPAPGAAADRPGGGVVGSGPPRRVRAGPGQPAVADRSGPGRRWTGWFSLPAPRRGVLASAPSASPWGAGLLDGRPRLTVFVRGTDRPRVPDHLGHRLVPLDAHRRPPGHHHRRTRRRTTMQSRPCVLGRGTDDRCYAFFVNDPLEGRAATASAWASAQPGSPDLR